MRISEFLMVVVSAGFGTLVSVWCLHAWHIGGAAPTRPLAAYFVSMLLFVGSGIFFLMAAAPMSGEPGTWDVVGASVLTSGALFSSAAAGVLMSDTFRK